MLIGGGDGDGDVGGDSDGDVDVEWLEAGLERSEREELASGNGKPPKIGSADVGRSEELRGSWFGFVEKWRGGGGERGK